MRTSPPPISTDTAKNFRIPNTYWRPVLACGGALVVGVVLASQVLKASAPPVSAAGSDEVVWHLSVPASDVVEVQSVPVSGATLTGKIAPVADAYGTSPVGGEVARWVVEPGQKVEKAQPVVEISSGTASRAPSGAEIQQTQAEKAQIAASDGQMAMAQQMLKAQSQLRDAKARVDQAQSKVSQARDLVRRLRNGETVTLPNQKLRQAEAASISPEAASSAKQLKVAQGALSTSQEAADKAHAEVKAAEKALADARNQIDIAGVQVESTENKFTDQKATADEVQNARSALNDAQAALKTATTRLETAKRNASARDNDLIQNQADLQNIQASAGKIKAAPTDEPAANDTVSIEQAATLVASALQESRDAAREAERLKNRIDSYKSQASEGQRALEAASKQLQNAQETVIESAPRPKFTAALSPVAGQVVWISRLAREVGPGQSVFGISTGRKSRVMFEDKGQLWKRVKAGQVVQAVAAPPAAPVVSTSATTGSPTPAPTVEPVAPLFAAIPLQVRLVKIDTPDTPSAPATVEGEIMGMAAATLGNDSQIIASVPTETKSLPSVPTTAIISYQDKTLMAVLTPTSAQENSEAATPTASPTATTAPTSTSAPLTPEAQTTTEATAKPELYHLVWRTVSFGKSNGVRTEIKSGVKVGDRVLINAAPFLAQAPPDAGTMPLVELTSD